MRLSMIVFGASALVFLVSSCGKKQDIPEQSTKAYPTLVVKNQDAELLSVYPATIKGQEDIEIRPRVDGFIDAIYVDEGSVVKKGQVLFKINSPQSEQALESAVAQLNSSQARLNTAEVDVKRIRPLASKGIVSEVQLQTFENAYKSAKATLEQAEATLKSAKASMGWTNVTSPVDGIVGDIPYRLGSLVNSANILTTVANTNNVFVYFSLNEKELNSFLNDLQGITQAEKLKNSRDVTLTLANGNLYPEKGRIETITGLVNVSTGSATLRAEFPNKEGILRSGTSGKISVPRTLHNVFVVPQKATFAQQDKVLIYKVGGDSVSQKIISVTAMPDGKYYAVTDGLSEGDRIVTDGVATLSNGKRIQFD